MGFKGSERKDPEQVGVDETGQKLTMKNKGTEKT